MTMPDQSLGNRAIHQLDELTQLQDGDVFVIARPLGGSYVDRRIDAATFPQRTLQADVTIPSASVLALGTTPYQLIPAPGAGLAIVPKAMLVRFVNGTTDYTTNTNVAVKGAGGNAVFNIPIDSEALSPVLAAGVLAGGNLVDNGALVAEEETGNPADGDYDLVCTIWYQIVTI